MLQIDQLSPAGLAALRQHLARHKAESGGSGIHFMPFAPDDAAGLSGADPAALSTRLSEPNWQRWFAALEDNARIVGHLDLRGAALASDAHRCTLGVGIEAAYRAQGVGRRLLGTGIEFCRRAKSIDWIDLGVFSNNPVAIALYKSAGFTEVGLVPDRFRIGGQQIDDLSMVLAVSQPAVPC
jgi:ribosomal protein S18 acetylase RimI-like enzyme